MGERHRGIAVASCTVGNAAPAIERPGHVWSREEVLAWCRDQVGTDTLIGLDLGMALPFCDRGAYFPGWSDSPAGSRDLWALIDRLCEGEAHLAAGSFVDHPHAARHFRRHGGRAGDLFEAGRGRLRVTEHHQLSQGASPVSNFNLVGAAQVGKASLTGMRLLHRLAGEIPVWPFDPLPDRGPVLVEIYTSIAAIAAGRPRGRSKMRTVGDLDAALAAPAIGSEPFGTHTPSDTAIDDHRSDALLTAAWLRRHGGRPELWAPAAMTATIAATEGWTFGVP